MLGGVVPVTDVVGYPRGLSRWIETVKSDPLEHSRKQDNISNYVLAFHS